MNFNFSTKKLLIILAILDVLAIAGYAYGFNLLVMRNGQVVEATLEVASFSLKNETLSSLQIAMKNAEQGMKEIDEYYIAPDGAVDFISIIESIAKNRGLTILVDSVETADIDKNTKDFQEHLVMRIQIEGPWAGVTQFLQLIENLPYNVYVTQGDLVKLDSAGTQNVINRPGIRWRGEFEIMALKLK